MDTIEYKRLMGLLKNSKDPMAVNCLERIQQEVPKCGCGSSVPANEVRDIYLQRKSWNESSVNPKRGRISGYEQLVSLLPKGADQRVKIHDLEWPDATILIFTDCDTVKYFGLLIIPKI